MVADSYGTEEYYITFLERYTIGAGRNSSIRERRYSWRSRTRHLDKLYEEAFVPGLINQEEWSLVYEAEAALETAQKCVRFATVWKMAVDTPGRREKDKDKATYHRLLKRSVRSSKRSTNLTCTPTEDCLQRQRMRRKQAHERPSHGNESYATFLKRYTIGANRNSSARDRRYSWRSRTHHLNKLYEEAVVRGLITLEEWSLVYEAEAALENAQKCVCLSRQCGKWLWTRPAVRHRTTTKQCTT